MLDSGLARCRAQPELPEQDLCLRNLCLADTAVGLGDVAQQGKGCFEKLFLYAGQIFRTGSLQGLPEAAVKGMANGQTKKQADNAQSDKANEARDNFSSNPVQRFCSGLIWKRDLGAFRSR